MPNKEEVEKDLGIQTDLQTLSDSIGGKILIKSLKEDILSSLSLLVLNRATYTLQEYVSLASDIKSKLDIVSLINKAKDNKKFLESLLEEEKE